ncbi:MAG TPA: MFS transporter [Thermoplasmata archaeon]|nr:MFS transporter [Thermoplasmata archaeon]
MDTSTPAARRSPTLWALAAYQFLANNRGGLFVVYMPVFLVELRGASDVLALSLVSAGYVGASLTGPFAGRWSDRTGRRKTFLLAGEVGSLPIFLSIPFLPGALGAGLGFIVAQIVLSMSAPALNAFVADISAQAGRGEGYGLLNATSAFGGIIGFVVAAILVVPFGLNVLFYFVAAVMIGTVTVIARWVPDLRQTPTVTPRAWREYGPLTQFSTVVSIRSLGAGAVATFFGVDAVVLGASNLDVGIIAIAGLIAAGLVSLPVGRYIDRRGEIQGIFYGTAVMLAGLVFFSFATTWWYFIPGQVLRQVGFAFLGPGMLAFVARMAPMGRRAEYLGIFALINSTLWSLGPLAGGLALELGGPPALFGFAFGTTLISVAAIEGVYRRPGRRRGVEGGAPHIAHRT